MCLRTLHDKVRNLGLGAMYEKHWGNGGFRDLLDHTSPNWASSAIDEKVNDLEAFAAAGVPVEELINNYRETLAKEPGNGGGGGGAGDSLPATLRAYRDAGYTPPPPGDLAAALDTPHGA